MQEATPFVGTVRRIYPGVIRTSLLCAVLAVGLYVFGAREVAGMVRWLAVFTFVLGVVLAGIATSEPD